MKKRLLIAGLCVLCAISMAGGNKTYATNMSSVTSDTIKEKEAQINQAQKEKQNLKNNLSDIQKLKKNLEAQKADLKKYVAQLDSNLEEMQRNIEELKHKILLKEQEIAETEEELRLALEKEETQMDAMVTHIRVMYEIKDTYMKDIFVSANGFKDILNRADYMENVMTYDQKQWRDFLQTRKYVELCKQELEVEKETLDEAKTGVEQEQKNLEELIAQKEKDIKAYEADINNQEKAIREYEAEIAAQDSEIKMLEAAIAEERKRIIAENGKVLTYDGGVFKFPLASYTRISDDYGMRMHPTLKIEKFHSGVDFASPAGTAIYAAYDGVVVASTYSATMGNYIMIDHGDELYTIYMHASKLYKQKGDVVARGDTIAAVGTTGRSTGNHLHFGVRKSGSYVSPWNYLSQ